MPSRSTQTTLLPTSYGTFRAEFSERGLRSLLLPKGPPSGKTKAANTKKLSPEARELFEALEVWFETGRVTMSWERYDLSARPPFYAKVWRVLYEIPRGQTLTYAQVAKKAGSPKALRAAGQACGANPVPLFIPCHRVLATQGLGGFGAGLAWKKWLLELEGIEL